MESLEKQFPEGMKYAIVFNPTTFVEESVAEVVKTLFEAVALVAIVVLFVFAKLASGSDSYACSSSGINWNAGRYVIARLFNQ